MGRLVDCPSCGSLRHPTETACPHCSAAGFSRRSLRQLALVLAVGSATTSCLAVKYGPAPVCTPPECSPEQFDASAADGGDGGDGGTPDDAGEPDGGDSDSGFSDGGGADG